MFPLADLPALRAPLARYKEVPQAWMMVLVPVLRLEHVLA
jgi:hypothetical protein